MSIIKNYGFMWERQYIFRGRGSIPGHLNGKSKDFIADFAKQLGVYILYDRNQSINYVGQAGNGNAHLLDRLKQHMDGPLRSRWDYFTFFGFRNVKNDGYLSEQQKIDARVSGFRYAQALDQLEGILITSIEPNLNKQGPKLNGAKRFYQIIDREVEPKTNADIFSELQTIREAIGIAR